MAHWKHNYTRYRAYVLNTMVEYRKKRNLKSYLEIILSLVAISLFSIFALRPTLTTIAKLLKEIEVKEETLTTMNSKIDDLTRAQTLYRQEKERLALVDTALPKSSEPDKLIQQLETLNSKYSSNVKSMSTGNTSLLSGKEVAKSSEEVTFTVSLTSDYSSLSGFLTDLERFRRLVQINSVQFKTSEQEEVELQLFINGSALYQPRPSK